MVTVASGDKYYKFVGLSTDDKPTHWNGSPLINGCILKEMDTGNTYIYDADSLEWVLQPSDECWWR